jgi:hypothetical protein
MGHKRASFAPQTHKHSKTLLAQPLERQPETPLAWLAFGSSVGAEHASGSFECKEICWSKSVNQAYHEIPDIFCQALLSRGLFCGDGVTQPLYWLLEASVPKKGSKRALTVPILCSPITRHMMIWFL